MLNKFYYSRWFVLSMLFLLAGPFGLPLLWKSPRFSGRAKGLLTAAVLIYTAALVVLSGMAFQKLLRQVQQFEASLG